MTVQDPPWRQRTRPCPFYSQGRCLFADSCNFLHDIKVKNPPGQSLVDVHVAQPVGSRVFLPPRTVLNPPSVVINSASPRSTQLVSPVDDTSRYFGLLSVLQDVIGPTSEDGETLTPRPANMNDIFLPNSPADTTMIGFSMDVSALVEESDLCDTQDSSVVEVPRDAGEIQEILACRDIGSDDSKEVGDVLPLYVVGDEDGEEEQEQDPEEAGEDRSQFISMTILRFPTPPSRFSSMSTASSVLSLLACPHDLPMEEPLDNSGQEVYNDLLSPVELSARLRPFSMYSYNFPPKRQDSIDSGYADSWTGPALLARSPPHSMRNSIAFNSTPSRRASVSLLQDRRVSYDVRGVRPSPRQPVVTEEHEDDTSSTLSILDAYDVSSDLDEEPLSPTVRLAGIVLTPPLSPPVEPSFPKQPSVIISESAPIHDSTLEAPSLQPDSAPEADTEHATFDADSPLDLLVSPLSSSTACPSSVKGIFPSREAVLVGMEFCSLPPSPLPEPAASDVHIVSRADDVITPSVSSYLIDSEFMEGELSLKVSLLSLGTFPSGRSSPNTSILSVECDYTADDMTQETVFSQPPSPQQSGLIPAQSPTLSPVRDDDDDMDGYGLREDHLYASYPTESRELSIARPSERPRISRELLAHIGHVFSLSDDMPVPAGDALDTTGSGSDVQTDGHHDSWHDALNADVQQALRMSSMSPVIFLSDDTDFDHDEAGVRTSWSPQLRQLFRQPSSLEWRGRCLVCRGGHER
ncbi:uncharacterized protein BJ212DRAFT_58743 [Suillus subaureus]|uniref:C3H1-type domain-containing protein n=1 Tax=Suillus subaureus TaxID=48587 RepID=A0A9P7JKS6_9AGAM|nr:uncharacterized protein BJ212DRAFT_58743 [Suillus subaureus]KAG1827534.1 hypothetical protein BJ212DRAFT_58743 [Suillus subaureus]